MRMRQRALDHRARDGFADGAVARQQIIGNAQQFGLGRVGIGDEPALDDIGRAGDLGEQRRDQAAGTTFRGGKPEALRAQAIEQRSGIVQQSRQGTSLLFPGKSKPARGGGARR